MTYTMHVERNGKVVDHGFHLGTDRRIAVTFVMEELRKDGVISVALRKDGKLDRIFDWRDLEADKLGTEIDGAEYAIDNR